MLQAVRQYATSAQDTIELAGVSKQYGSITALGVTDLTVRKGEFLTLLGPSGSGKTTVLNLISGAAAPSTGRVILNGRDITQAPPRDRGIGMVFQNYALMPHMTVFQNVAYPLRIRRQSKADIARKVTEALARVGLSGFENRKPRQLSGGQQQRVGIARCIVYSPAIILMDEPLGALDKNLREQMQDEIKHLHRDLGTTFIYVTHDQEEALNMSDRICLMSNGEIAQLGTPDELYFAPRSRFVAEFIGESNLIAGTLEGNDCLLTKDGTRIRIPTGSASAASAAIEVMVRPEKLRIKPTDGTDSIPTPVTNEIQGEIQTVSFVGGMTRIAVVTPGGMTFTSKVVSDRASTRLCQGTPVCLSWDVANTVILAN